jgi:hypothetical protein
MSKHQWEVGSKYFSLEEAKIYVRKYIYIYIYIWKNKVQLLVAFHLHNEENVQRIANSSEKQLAPSL